MRVDLDQIGWNQIGIHKYYINNGSELLNFEDAVRKCENLNSHLAIVDSDEIHFDIVRIIKSMFPRPTGPPYMSFFIGLQDYTGNNANFMWINGDLLHFITGTPMHWAEGEPNNFNRIDEDCVTMGSAGYVSNYDWFDVPCDSKRSYICQKYTEESYNSDITSVVFSSFMLFLIMGILFLTAFQQRKKLHNKDTDYVSLDAIRKGIPIFGEHKEECKIIKTTSPAPKPRENFLKIPEIVT